MTPGESPATFQSLQGKLMEIDVANTLSIYLTQNIESRQSPKQT